MPLDDRGVRVRYREKSQKMGRDCRNMSDFVIKSQKLWCHSLCNDVSPGK